MKSKTFFTVLVFLICLFAKADIAVAEAKKIKLGIISSTNLLPVFLAQEKGWYQEAGLDVETIEMKGGATIIPAILGGSIQIGFSNVISVMLAQSAGLDIKIVCNSHNEGYTKKVGEPGGYATSTPGLFVLQNSGIRDPKDLEGKKIAVNAIKNIDWMAVWDWMDKNNADPKKVIWVETDFPKMIPALMGKKVDAVEAGEPQKAILRSQGATLLVNTLHDLRPGLIIASFVAKEEWISKNSILVQGFVSATVKGQDYLNAHPEERNKLFIQYTKTSPEIVKNITWPQWTSKVDFDGMHFLIKLCQKHGLLKKSPDLENLIYKTAR
jgi:NitT/TauT family transport system substrate-binding protein